MHLPHICESCTTHICCLSLGPLMSTAEYMVMSQVAGEETCLVREPTFNGKRWYFNIPGPCPALSETGCRIPYESRPLACRIAPFVLVPLYQGKDKGVVVDLLLSLYCPHWREFGEYYQETIKEVTGK